MKLVLALLLANTQARQLRLIDQQAIAYDGASLPDLDPQEEIYSKAEVDHLDSIVRANNDQYRQQLFAKKINSFDGMIHENDKVYDPNDNMKEITPPQSMLQLDPASGPAIAICNGGNDGACTEAEDVVLHTLRRPGRMAGPGDPDDIPETETKPERNPAILYQAPNPAIQHMLASFVQTDEKIMLRDAETGLPLAYV